jgi:hypothetical protein
MSSHLVCDVVCVQRIINILVIVETLAHVERLIYAAGSFESRLCRSHRARAYAGNQLCSYLAVAVA